MNKSAPSYFERNGAWDCAAPKLSVLIPFFRYDPSRLLKVLDREAAILSGAAEIILLDDGSGDDALASLVSAAVRSAPSPIAFMRLLRNKGRAKGRNILASHARARHLLFLDSDMLPDSPSFLATYLKVIEEEDPAVVVGGVSVRQAPRRRELALHRHWMERLECFPAEARRTSPIRYVYSQNVMVRRDAFAAESFDERFSGWGWEDIEWGARLGGRWRISHINNTATHLGLDTPEALIAKCEESPANFRRLAAAHPEFVADLPSYRAARLLRHAPLRRVGRRLLPHLVRMPLTPIYARLLALRLYRALLYAEVV
jgi:glycosyltransferase involved in cell wall biosynthesis